MPGNGPRDDVTYVLTYFRGISVSAINTVYNNRANNTAKRERNLCRGAAAGVARPEKPDNQPTNQTVSQPATYPRNVFGADGAQLYPSRSCSSPMLARRSAERYAILD